MSGVSRTTAASGDKCKAGAIIVPELELGCSTVEDHCTALRKCGRTFFWWYMGTGKFSWNYTVPFRDGAGGWWYQVKPGLCWPVDFLGKIDRAGKMPLTKKFLGYQHLAAEPGRANSRLVINVIEDLRGFDAGMIDSKRRNIRAGARACVLEVLTRPDAGTLAECSALWNGFSARTGWKSPVPVKYFAESWSRMMDIPGVSITVARAADTGRVAGFLVAKIIGDTVYVDTIASSSDLLKTRVNDILIHALLMNAKRMPHVRKAHYSLVSRMESLERFKMSHGFVPCAYPAYTFLMPAVGALLRAFSPGDYDRMTGRMDIPVISPSRT